MTSDGGHLSQPALGLRDHAGGALQQRLENQGGVGLAALFLPGKTAFHLVETLPLTLAIVARVRPFGLGAVEAATIAVRRHHLIAAEEEAAIGLMEEVDVPKADRANGVAVIGAFEGKKTGRAVTVAARILVGQFERHFERRRAVVTKEHPGQFGGSSRGARIAG